MGTISPIPEAVSPPRATCLVRHSHKVLPPSFPHAHTLPIVPNCLQLPGLYLWAGDSLPPEERGQGVEGLAVLVGRQGGQLARRQEQVAQVPRPAAHTGKHQP
jgi:hypothetical protein